MHPLHQGCTTRSFYFSLQGCCLPAERAFRVQVCAGVHALLSHDEHHGLLLPRLPNLQELLVCHSEQQQHVVLLLQGVV